MFSYLLVPFVAITTPTNLHTDPVEDSQENITVYGRKLDNLGQSISVSQGSISRGEIEQRPVLRSGEILEFVPGMVVTQHSGSGKANQYFLRGFNLDHGTDFRTTIDNMPINMNTHGHGQGYTDLSFITPEFIQRIDFRKGPYHALDGDFSTAGSAKFVLANIFDKPMLQLEFGEDAYFRTIAAGSINLGKNDLTLGIEHHRYDGPWTDIKEDVEKTNVLVKYSSNKKDTQYSVTFMGYDNLWNAADQIPDRAVQSGLIDRLGSLDTDTGGDANRYSLSFNYQHNDFAADAYLITSKLNLFSNFTYFLEDPINGDEFQQVDDRIIYGGQLIREFENSIGSGHIHHMIGLQYRYDDIDDVGLHKTNGRQRVSTIRLDQVKQRSAGLFWNGEMHLSDDLIVGLGLRYDRIMADVKSTHPLNSGSASDALFSVKGSVQYRLNNAWTTFFNAGQSFHSNDARGATATIDPVSGNKIEPADFLVRGNGAEWGWRYFTPDKFNISFSLWWLELDSELLFVGDAGNTEVGGASRRSGVEFTGYYWIDDEFSLDLELAWSRARFTDAEEGEGDRVEGSVPLVASLGAAWSPTENFRTALRLRYFGQRALDSMGDEKSDTFTVVNASVTYQLGDWETDIQLLNLFNSNDHDIDYLYTSRLPGEPEQGVLDNHFHPIEPRTLRVGVRYFF